MTIQKSKNTIFLVDMIEQSPYPVYIILDNKKIELTGNRNLLNLFRKYWDLEDVTEVTLETENMDLITQLPVPQAVSRQSQTN